MRENDADRMAGLWQTAQIGESIPRIVIANTKTSNSENLKLRGAGENKNIPEITMGKSIWKYLTCSRQMNVVIPISHI